MEEFQAAALDHDKGAPAPYHLWAFFFREGFLSRFDRRRGRAGSWHRGNANVYRRHPWNRRDGLPDGREGAVNGFGRLGLRWWRRNLLRTYRKWIARRITSDIIRLLNKKCITFGRKKKGDSPQYWWKGELEQAQPREESQRPFALPPSV